MFFHCITSSVSLHTCLFTTYVVPFLPLFPSSMPDLTSPGALCTFPTRSPFPSLQITAISFSSSLTSSDFLHHLCIHPLHCISPWAHALPAGHPNSHLHAGERRATHGTLSAPHVFITFLTRSPLPLEMTKFAAKTAFITSHRTPLSFFPRSIRLLPGISPPLIIGKAISTPASSGVLV